MNPPMSIDAADLADSLRGLAMSGEGHDGIVSAIEQVLGACVDLFAVEGAGMLVADEQDMLRYVTASDRPAGAGADRGRGRRRALHVGVRLG